MQTWQNYLKNLPTEIIHVARRISWCIRCGYFMYMWCVTNKITFQGFFKRVWRMSLYVSIHECTISPKMRDCFPEFSTFNINFSYLIQRYLKNSKWFSELPYLASKSNFRNLLVIKVQDKGICFLPWSGFITNSEVCTKVNINLWNVDITGQNLPVSIVLEGQCGFMLFYTWKICTLVIHNYGVLWIFLKRNQKPINWKLYHPEDVRQPLMNLGWKLGHLFLLIF